MPIAVSVATRSGLAATAVADLARRAEDRGLDAFYVAESASDSFVLAQAALAATSSIAVGTAVANARLRHPAAAAMSAATLTEWSGGRFRLGLGVSNPRFNEQALRMAPISPVEFMRDYVLDMRRALAANGAPGTVNTAGGTWGARSDGALAVQFDRPVTTPVPIALAAMRPKMLRLAGQIADAVVLSLTTPTTLGPALQTVSAGAAAGGRDRSDIIVECVLPCCFDDDRAAAYRAGRGVVIGYARHPAAAQLFQERGFGDQLSRVVAALDAGDLAAAHAGIADEMVDEFALVGDLDRCADRIANYVAAGVDRPLLFPLPADGDWDGAVRRTIDLAPSLLSASTDTRRVLT